MFGDADAPAAQRGESDPGRKAGKQPGGIVLEALLDQGARPGDLVQRAFRDERGRQILRDVEQRLVGRPCPQEGLPEWRGPFLDHHRLHVMLAEQRLLAFGRDLEARMPARIVRKPLSPRCSASDVVARTADR